MKIAQIVITRTKDDEWKIAIMSLKETDEIVVYKEVGQALGELVILMTTEDWEELSL